MASTPAWRTGAISTRRSAMPGVSMPATRTGMGSVRCTSPPWRGSGPCCAPGSARPGASRKTSSRSISASSSSSTTRAGVGEPCSAPLSQAWLREPAPPPRKPTRAALVFDLPPRPSAGRKLGHSLADNREIGDKAVAVGDLALGVQDLDHQPVDGQRLLVAAQRHPAEPAVAMGEALLAALDLLDVLLRFDAREVLLDGLMRCGLAGEQEVPALLKHRLAHRLAGMEIVAEGDRVQPFVAGAV